MLKKFRTDATLPDNLKNDLMHCPIALPAISALSAFEKSLQSGDLPDLDGDGLRTWMNSYSKATSEATAACKQMPDECVFKTRIKAWQARMESKFQTRIHALKETAQGLKAAIQESLIEKTLKAWIKTFGEEESEAIINYHGRHELVENVKLANKTLKSADTYVSLCPRELVTDLSKAKDDLTTTRNSARTQITYRCAAVILKDQRHGDIKKFYASASLSRVTIPQSLKAKIDAVKPEVVE